MTLKLEPDVKNPPAYLVNQSVLLIKILGTIRAFTKEQCFQ